MDIFSRVDYIQYHTPVQVIFILLLYQTLLKGKHKEAKTVSALCWVSFHIISRLFLFSISKLYDQKEASWRFNCAFLYIVQIIIWQRYKLDFADSIFVLESHQSFRKCVSSYGILNNHSFSFFFIIVPVFKCKDLKKNIPEYFCIRKIEVSKLYFILPKYPLILFSPAQMQCKFSFILFPLSIRLRVAKC